MAGITSVLSWTPCKFLIFFTETLVSISNKKKIALWLEYIELIFSCYTRFHSSFHSKINFDHMWAPPCNNFYIQPMYNLSSRCFIEPFYWSVRVFIELFYGIQIKEKPFIEKMHAWCRRSWKGCSPQKDFFQLSRVLKYLCIFSIVDIVFC